MKKLRLTRFLGIIAVFFLIINLLQCSALTTTLRPNAAGDITDLWTNSAPIWDAVNDVTPDEDTTVVGADYYGYATDMNLYNLPSSSGQGPINNIIITCRCRRSGELNSRMKTVIKTGGTVYTGALTQQATTYTNYQTVYTLNPYTGVSWIWSDIDSLQIGVYLTASDDDAISYCTQVYIVVDYNSCDCTSGSCCDGCDYYSSGTSCGTKDCDYLNYYFDSGVDSPTGTNYCVLKDYADCTKTCTGSSTDCPDCSCSSYADSTVAACGTCRYCAGSSCSNYVAGTDTGTCRECNGVGGERTPSDDSACGTIDCDGKNYYFDSGKDSPTETNYCILRDYADITSSRCEGLGDCKDANSADCISYYDSTVAACGDCSYCDGAGCTNYGTSTVCGTETRTCTLGENCACESGKYVCDTGTDKTCQSTCNAGSCSTCTLDLCDKTNQGTDTDGDGMDDECVTPCSLSTASWSTTSTTEGEIITLTLTGSNCDGQQATFTVTEEGLISQGPASIQPSPATFSGGTATTTWIAEWVEDSFDISCWCFDPEYEFVANVGSVQIVSDSLLSTISCDCTSGVCCSDGCNYDATGTVCNNTDHCSGETWYTGYSCDGTGSCINNYGPQDKDSNESYCVSTEINCTARTWFDNSCCGDDTNEFYDGAGSCDGTHACCDSASDHIRNGICVSNCISPSAIWENLNGEEITQTNKGDTVKLVLTNASSGTFEVYEDDKFLNPDDHIRTIVGVIEGNKIVAYWTITAEDLELTEDYEDFYFKVDGDEEKRSNYLSIPESYNNTPTSINILSPACGEYFDAGANTVNITVNADDDDDFIEGTLSVNGEQIGTFKNGNTNVSHVFSVGGNYKIVAEASNSRGRKSRTISNVMVIDTTVDGEYVAACITKPDDYSDIPTSYVEFDASGSLGIRYTVATGTSEIGLSGLKFNWLFSDGRTNPYINGTNQLSYKFFKNFKAVGNNWATLKVSII